MNAKKVLIIILGVFIILNLVFLVGFFGYFKNLSTGKSIFSDFDSKKERGFVGKVIDGDTVVVDGESVRLLGIDADEKGYDCYDDAKARLEELVLNKDILMEKDVRDKDQYKRKLRWIFIDEEERKNINLLLVEEGLAIARFYEDRKYREDILDAERKARAGGVGCKWKSLD